MIDSRYGKACFKDVISTMHQGINTAADKVKYVDAGIPIIQSKHFTAGKLELKDTKFMGPKDAEKYGDKYKPKQGDILFSNIGTVGKSVVVDNNYEFMFAWNVFLIKPKHELVFNQYLQHYLDYLLELNIYERWFTGGTVKFLNKKTIGNIEIPLPPLAEQQKIAAILDAADSLRQKDRQLVEKYTALSQSLFLEMFGDIEHNHKNFDLVTINDVISDIKDGPHVSPEYSDNGIPILSTRNIRPFALIMDEVKYVSTEMYDILTKRFRPKKGDVLLTKGGTTGYAKVVDFDWQFCIWVHIAALRPKASLINPKYLEAALNSHYCYHQSQLLTKGIANKDLGLKRIVNIALLLPPITLQNQFAERIRAIEAQKQLAQANLEKSEALFNSLLQRTFKGELTA